MKPDIFRWVVIPLLVVTVVALPLIEFLPRESVISDDPWSRLDERPYHTDHTALMAGPFESGPEVTRACLACHEQAGQEVLVTAHWRW